jgi:hypothetical protein
LCRGPALGGWKDNDLKEESENDEPTVQPGLASRANLQESMHASYFRAIGGKRMPLDIVNAVLSELGPSILQMSRAKAQKEGLVRKTGVSQEERAAKEEEHRKTIVEMAKEMKKGELRKGKEGDRGVGGSRSGNGAGWSEQDTRVQRAEEAACGERFGEGG